MKWRCFEPAVIVSLRSNPYTLSVTEKTITFTLTFKQKMLEGIQSGRSPFVMMEELGYDPEVFGETRIKGIAYHIVKEAESPEGLHEGRRAARTARAVTEEEAAANPPSYVLRRLQAEVSYLRQEMEFLKKIIRAETEQKRGK